MSRQLKTKIYINPRALEPQVQTGIKKKLEEQRKQEKAYYDQKATRKVHFKENDRVFMQKEPQGSWTEARIKSKADAHR